ncbi:MAG: nitrite reductase small subunit NirD [Hyphomicrobiales bacterium]
MSNFIKVGTVNDIPLRGARQVQYGDTTIAVFRNAQSKIFALEDKCPHSGCPVSNGIVHDTSVTCPIHNWVVSLETGDALGADEGKTLSFPVKMDGENILISL